MPVPHPLLNGTKSLNGGTYPDSPTSLEHSESSASQKLPDEEIVKILENHYPVGDVVPPEHWGRTLVLCFDGTGDQFDNDNSNIVEFFRLLKKDDRKKQMVYYQAGIGTYTSPSLVTPMAAKVSKNLDAAIAWNLHSHVMDGYEFLMQNYTEGDRICIFGFSRGAYTARSLAGMIHKVGILPACNHQQIPFAYKMYTAESTKENDEQASEFKATFSTDVDIEFVGVWDTVDSVGIIPRRLPFTGANDIIRTFRHALALDERRAKFKANHFHRNAEEDAQHASHHHARDNLSTSRSTSRSKHKSLKAEGKSEFQGKNEAKGKNLHGQGKVEKDRTLLALKQKYSKLEEPWEGTDCQEASLVIHYLKVWFAGCHCDVGGGSVANSEKTNLARIPLRWMIRECFNTNSGIMFYKKGLEELGIKISTLYPLPEPRLTATKIDPQNSDHCVRMRPREPSMFSRMTSRMFSKKGYTQIQNRSDSGRDTTLTEEHYELKDAMSPAYDQLDISWFWWILEYLPLLQVTDGASWRNYFWSFESNWGQGRVIPSPPDGEKVLVHRSVGMRMEAAHELHTGRYQPVAKNFAELLEQDRIKWVDDPDSERSKRLRELK
ncbi:hypothetical protein VNI00_012262 [Paramarasmius palmivorus]|uniref:T6SS Phospholipase effector Tle1-like catalytic domain-containing protein n=1 Tax=Paramarasmius palmivorus TaxID=297713 RepID=A0AAW0C8Q2_9AGAR